MKLSSLCTVACVLAASLSLSGCNSIGAKYPTSTDTPDPLDYLRQFVEADEHGLLNPFRVLDIDNRFVLKDYSNHTYWRRVWCSKTDKFRFQDEIKNICKANGGDWENSWCIHSKSKAILFEASVGSYDLCSRVKGVIVDGYFPKRGMSYTDPAWQNFVGYRKAQYDIKLDTKQRETEKRAQEEARRQKLKQKENKFLLSPAAKGTKVCRKERNDVLAIGFVEDFGPSKIKINVVFLGYPPSVTLGGFQPHTIWDYPNNWYVCE